jgi:hypothetical protein
LVHARAGKRFTIACSPLGPLEESNILTLEAARSFLLYCTLINYRILLLWFVVFAAARNWMKGLHGRWFRLTDEQFDALHYGGMALYKIGIFLFNLAPFVALCIIG